MVEILWTLFLMGAGLLWAGLLYVSLSSYGAGDVDPLWPTWKVLLEGDRDAEEDVSSWRYR